MAKTLEQGGISNEVWNSEILQDYMKKGGSFGYVGAYGRTPNKDKIVENALKNAGLTTKGIAWWMESTDGRHLMDDGDSLKGKKFLRHAIIWCSNVPDWMNGHVTVNEAKEFFKEAD